MALPTLKTSATTEELSLLHKRLRDIGYNEANIAQLLGRFDISELNGKEYPSYIWRCDRDTSELAKAVALFLLGRASDRPRVTELLGADLVSVLERCGILVEFRGAMVSLPVVFPCLDKLFFTDQWVGTGNQEPGKVYELGTDSYALARVTPRRNVEKALDLCTGSGLHAIFSAAAGAQSQAVDINPRALHYTEFNALLNGVEVQNHLGDLYNSVKGQTFDLITANPPFVPSPDPNVLIHRSAGETGEEVPEKLVAGLSKHLEPGGLFSMILDHPMYEGETYLERLERWLGADKGWGIATLTFHELTPANYIMGHLSGVETYDETFRNYLESYLRLGIKSMRFANVFIRRLQDANAPNWKVDQRCNWPNISLVPQVEEWLDCQATYRDPQWRPDPDWTPNLSPNYKCLWRDWTHSRGVLEMADDNWLQPEPLNEQEAELLFQMKPGTRSISELQQSWDDEHAFLQALRGLGIRRALTPFSPRKD